MINEYKYKDFNDAEEPAVSSFIVVQGSPLALGLHCRWRK
jgi:hypothetical protein